MTYETWLQIILVGLVLLSIIITTVGSIVKKVKAKKAKGEKVDANYIFTEILNGVIDAVKSNENIFATLSNGGNIKTGVLKLERVLATSRELCQKYNIEFDKEKFEEIANKLVELININKSASSDDQTVENNKNYIIGGI